MANTDPQKNQSTAQGGSERQGGQAHGQMSSQSHGQGSGQSHTQFANQEQGAGGKQAQSGSGAKSQSGGHSQSRGGGGQSQSSGNGSLADRREQMTRDAQALMTDLRDAAEGIEEYVRRQLEERPYTTLAIAGGAGYIIGGGLATRVNRMAVGLASRIFIGLMAREIGMRLDLVREGDMPYTGHGEAIQ